MIQTNNDMNIIDWIKKPIKVYVYELTNINYNRTFLDTNSVSILSVQPYVIKKTNANFFNAIPQFEYSEGLKIANKDTFKERFGNEMIIDIYAQYLPIPTTKLNPKFVSQYDFKNTFIFTIDEPLDNDKFLQDDQQVFYYEGLVGELTDVDDKDVDYIIEKGFQTTSLINIKQITSQYKNASVQFVFANNNEINTLNTPTNNTNRQYQISLDSSILLSYSQGIRCIGSSNNIRKTINTELDGNFGIMKVIPFASNDNKVSLALDWWDYNVFSPLYIAKNVLNVSNGQDLQTILSNVDDYNCVIDMLLISSAFANQFANFPIETSANSVNYGKLKFNTYIGSKNIPITTIYNQNAIEVVNNVYQTWMLKNNLKPSDSRVRIVNIVLVMLSQYIYSQRCVGLGQNAFNQAYCPFYLRSKNTLNDFQFTTAQTITSGGITINDATTTSFKNDPEFVIESKFFDIDYSGTNIVIKPITKWLCNDDITIQTDRLLSIPLIPETITNIDKFPLPADVDLTSSKDLLYYVVIPFNNSTDFDTFYLDTAQKTIAPAQTISFNTDPVGVNDLLNVGNPKWEIDYIKKAFLQHYPNYQKDSIIISNKPNATFDIKNEISPNFDNIYGNKLYNFGIFGDTPPITTTSNSITFSNPFWMDKQEFASNFIKSLQTNRANFPSAVKSGDDTIYTDQQDIKNFLIWFVYNDRYVFNDDNYVPNGNIKAVWTDNVNPNIIETLNITKLTYTYKGSIKIEFTNTITSKGFLSLFMIRPEWDNVEFQLSTKQINYGIDNRDITYNREQFRQLLTNLKIAQPARQLTLKVIDDDVDNIDEILISAVWGEYISIITNNHTISIPLQSNVDETLGIRKILLN